MSIDKLLGEGLDIAFDHAQTLGYIEGVCDEQDVEAICKYLDIVPAFDHVCLSFVREVFRKLPKKVRGDTLL